MKKVAATRGQSVNFAALFFAMEMLWEGIWAGSDTVLNFFSRPPQVTLALNTRGASSPFEEYSLCARMQEKNERARKILSARQPYRSTSRTQDFAGAFCVDAGIGLPSIQLRSGRICSSARTCRRVEPAPQTLRLHGGIFLDHRLGCREASNTIIARVVPILSFHRAGKNGTALFPWLHPVAGVPLKRFVSFRIVGPNAGLFPFCVEIPAQAENYNVSGDVRLVCPADAVLARRVLR